MLNRQCFKQSTVFYFFIALSLASSFVSADEHPIDLKTQVCLDNNSQTDNRMKACSLQAYEDWDAELNKVYKSLRKYELNAKVKEPIINAQRKWLKYRNAEFEAIDSIYDSLSKKRGGGMMWGLLAADAKVKIVKNRVLILSSYLTDYKASLK